MKDIYVILAFHAHELLWELPKMMLSYLDNNNPMKDTMLDENYMKKRKEEDRDIYSLCIDLGERLNAPVCVEFSNELLFQIKDVLPRVFQHLKENYASGRLYPIYGHAHHTHVSLLTSEEITQEIQWNMQFLHYHMGVPYPKYKGLFAAEASYSAAKMSGIEKAGISYVIFPHLNEHKVPFSIKGEGNIKYKPFWISGGNREILAFPRNFPVSQEIWRPITRMKREAVKFQGYMLGNYPVFQNEYLSNEVERFPIDMTEAVEIYKRVLLQEVEQAPPGGVLLYIQDLELMDFGDIALEIMEKAWNEILQEEGPRWRIHFVSPGEYIDKVLKSDEIQKLPKLIFNEINWAPEIRLILRADGHYPPIGVTGVEKYDKEKTGLFQHPHIFWENGKYYCGLFATLLDNFNIFCNIPAHSERFLQTGYDLSRESPEVQAVMYFRLMKRACNWGWRPTEGRQKKPCLKGFLLCDVLLNVLEQYHPTLVNWQRFKLDERDIAGIVETLRVFIDNRVYYLKYGIEMLEKEKGQVMIEARNEIENVYWWKKVAVEKAAALFDINRSNLPDQEKIKKCLQLLQDYSQAVFMATEHIQKIWMNIPETEYMVEKMYEYLYNIYPPLFPSMMETIDAMTEKDIAAYFDRLKDHYYVHS